MAHVSKKKLNNEVLQKIDKQLINFFKDEKSKHFILSELLTETERLMLAKRLAIILLLKKGVSRYKIMKSLKVSPSTVARFFEQLEGGDVKKIQKNMGKQMTEDFVNYLMDILLIPFDRPYKGVVYKKRR